MDSVLPLYVRLSFGASLHLLRFFIYFLAQRTDEKCKGLMPQMTLGRQLHTFIFLTSLHTLFHFPGWAGKTRTHCTFLSERERTIPELA